MTTTRVAVLTNAKVLSGTVTFTAVTYNSDGTQNTANEYSSALDYHLARKKERANPKSPRDYSRIPPRSLKK